MLYLLVLFGHSAVVGCFVLVVKSFGLDVFGCWEVVEFHVFALFRVAVVVVGV